MKNIPTSQMVIILASVTLMVTHLSACGDEPPPGAKILSGHLDSTTAFLKAWYLIFLPERGKAKMGRLISRGNEKGRKYIPVSCLYP